MKKILFILFLLSIPALLLAQEPVREWKSKSGKTFIKALLDIDSDSDPETVYLLKDGKRYKVPFKNLSQADQDYVTRARSDVSGSNKNIRVVERNDNDILVPPGKRYALLIGVNRYAKPIKSLQFCVQDMKLLANSFQKTGIPRENITLVTDDSPFDRRPTGGNIRRQIERITRLMEPDDQLIIAFSGHGVMVEGKSYLCPSDTDLKDKHSIVSRDWIFDLVEKCQAKQKVFIIDACRSEISFDGQKAIGQVKTLEDPTGADTHGFILIASCDKKQFSWEHPDIQHGVFTYYFAEGLSGKAKNEEGYVTIMGLYHYASSRTKTFVKQKYEEIQVPTFRQNGEMTDFCLANLNRQASSSTIADDSSSKINLPSGSLKAGDRFACTINGVEFAFRYCPPGRFMMGSPESEEGRLDDETQHQVTLTKGFWMLETEVTVGMFKAFVDEKGYESDDDNWDQDSNSWRSPGFIQSDNHPVTCVSWNDAAEFCKWLSRKTGQNVTLPTEAQWEYACRAGTTSAYAGNPNEMGWYDNDDFVKTHPVKLKKPNNWGLYDMHGNVWEWCQDWKTEYPKASVTDPTAPAFGVQRVNRGGGWDSYHGVCRSAFRNNCDPKNQSNNLGFRCVIEQSNE